MLDPNPSVADLDALLARIIHQRWSEGLAGVV